MEDKALKSIERMKICFIAGTLGVGGAERQLYIILTAAKKLGMDVSLISLNSGEFWEEPIKNLGINYYTLNGKWNKTSRLLKIIALLRRIKPSIVHSQHFYTNLYAGIAAKFCATKSIGSSRSELKIEIGLNGFLGKWCFKMPDYLVANSQKSIEQAIELGRKPSKLFYLPNALDLEKFSPGLKTKSGKEDITLLAIGSLIPLKRFDRFIDLMSRLRHIYGDRIKGKIIGDGVLAGQLKQLAENAGLHNEIFEFVSHTSAPETYMKDADFLVISSEFEGTPNVALEAMACGLTVIATKVGNLPYFIKDGVNGFFYDGTVEHLSKIVIDQINDERRSMRISLEARRTMEESFSYHSLEKNLTYIYEQIARH